MLVINGLRAAAKDPDAEVRRMAIAGYAMLAPHADEDVIELLGTVIDEGMDDSYLRLTRVEHTTNDVGAVQVCACLHETGRVGESERAGERREKGPPATCTQVLV